MPSSSSSSAEGGARELASGKLVLDEPEPGLVRVTIRNPEKRGALDHEMLDALAGAARTIEARCLLLTGTGSTFSAGYDLGNLSGEQFEQRAQALVAHPFHASIEALEAYPYPAVAALNGHAIGGGLELALACDVRIAASGIKVGMPPARLGLIYSHTGLRKFVEVCGPAYTAELFYSGRNVDVERAHEMGLVNRVVDGERLAGEALELAGEIARNAPLSLAGNKRILRTLRHHAYELPASVERELVDLRESCFRSEDFREGVRAFEEKRRPVWRNR
jgi:enoyl-CoA hydratase/carnithine racemase